MIFSDLKRYFSYLLIYFISFCFFLSTSVQAADIQAQLDNSSNPGFSVQNNGGSTVARVDANGNLTTAGNVGVGTSSTDTLLDVSTGGVPSIVGAGDAFIQNNLEVDGTTYLEGLNMTGTGTFTGLPTFSNGTYSALFTGGNVGIGSSMPGKTLDVLGALRTSQFVMTGQTPISGYVLTATDSLGDASWTASTAVAGSISGLTTNFITKASSSTSITNSLLFDNGTNMGIGSTNPGATLDIQGTLRTTQFTMSGQTPVGGYVLTAVDSNGTTSWSPAGTVSGWTESGANVYETSGGNVGIGSANPGQALDVQGSIRSLGVIDTGVAGSSLVMTNANQQLIAAVAGTNYAAATSGSNLLFGNGAGGFTNVVNTTTSGGNIGLGSTNPGTTLDIQGTLRTTQFTMSGQTPVSGYVLTAIDSNGTTSWSPAGSVSGWTESGANVYETSGGNVGIGSANPGQALDVQGSIRSLGVIDTGVTGSSLVMTNANQQLIAAVAGTNYAVATSGSNLLFGNGAGGFTNVTTTTTNGTNIGIGSTAPGQILDIQGTLRTTQFTMSGQTPVSGYVLTAVDSNGTTSWSPAGSVSGWTESGANVYETSGGNVGIGSTNPGQALDVQGTMRSLGVITNGAYTQNGPAANTFTGPSTFNNNAYFNGGNVGVGSVNPGQTLDVLGTLRTTQFTMSGQTPVSGYVLTAVDSTGATSWSPAGSVSGWTMSGLNVYETGGGNVGIGSVNPSQALDVQGTIKSLGLITNGAYTQTGILANTFTGTATFNNATTSALFSNGNVGINSAAPGQWLDVQGTVRSLAVITGAYTQTGAAANTFTGPSTFNNNTFFSGGNVGVGSTNPGTIFDIQGTLRTTQFTMSGQTPVSGYVLTAVDSTGATSWSPAGSVSGWTTSGTNVYETSGGNVGIGSVNPAQALDVEGTIKSIGLITNGAYTQTGTLANTFTGTATFNNATTSALFTGGNVGVGSTNPGQTLDVLGTIRSLAVITNGAYTQNGNAANSFTGPSTFSNNTFFNDGNVGVGSTNPGTIFDIQGTLRTTQFTMSGQTPVSGYVLTAVDSTGATSWSPAGSVSGWTTSGANVYETSGGNVGIGSVNPAQALDVEGTIKSIGLITNGAYTQTGTLANTFTGTATFNNATTSALFSNGNVGINSAAPGQWLDVQGTVRSLAVITGAYTQTGAAANTFTGPSTFNNNTFFSGGNVGVGSTNPGTIFDIQGTLRTTQFTMSGQTPVSGYVLTAVDSTGATSWSPAGSVSGWTTSGTNVYETSGGNVGIGSVNPAQALDVEGTIKSIGLITNGAYTQTGTLANTFTGTATFNNATTSALFTGGNVGVGSTNPGQTLDVLGTIRSLAVITNGAYTQNGNAANSFTGPSTFSNNTFFNGGNVGVGSSAPGQILDIQGTLRTTQFTMSGQTPVSGYVLTAVDSTGATSWSPAGSVSGWTESGNNLYETNSSGNVGIGSANPVQALDVEGTIRSIGLMTNGAYTQTGAAANTFTGPSTFSNNAYFNGGNVGVGSANPGQPLDVQGTVRALAFVGSGAALTNLPAGGAAGSTNQVQYNVSGNLTGSNSFVFDGTNVGVGSSAPGQTLDIQGTLRTTQFTMSGQTPVGGYVLTAVDSTGATSWSPAGSVSGWTTSGSNVYETNGSGNVGIGSSNPGVALDMVSNAPASAMIRLENTSATGYSSFEYSDSTGTGRGSMGYANSSAGSFPGTVYMVSSGVPLVFSSNPPVANMEILTNGNVGINSTAPGQTLDVQGTLRTTQFTMSGQTPVGGYVLTAVDSTGATSWSPAGSVSGWTTSGNNVYETNGSGNVGIGSANPVQALDVEGTIRSIGLITNGGYAQSGAAANTFTGPSTFSNNAFFNGGNVGVGSSTPGQILDIQGTLRTTQFTMSGQTPVGGYVLTAVDSTGATSWSPAGSVSGWTVSGSNLFETNGSGNVGIGSANPVQALDVEGTIRSIGLITNGGYAQSGAAANTFTGPSTFSNNAFFNGGNVGVGSSTPGQILDIQGTLRTTQFTMSGQTPVGGYVLTAVDSTGATSWSPAGSVSGWTTSGNNVYETNGSGNVGIGSANPVQALDVEGTIRSIGLITNGGYAQSGAAANTFTGPSTFSNNAFFNGGNVGVGSSTPGQILDIQGTLRTTQFTMSGQTPVGGYVLTAVDSTGATSWSPAGSVSGWTTSGNNVYETNGSGNVGIGSANPVQALDVEGTIRSIGLITNGGYAQSGAAANTFTGPSTFSNNAFFNGGNVGVGSTNPGTTLDIQGTLRTTQFTMSGQTPVGGYVLTAVDSTGATSWSPAGSVSGWTVSGSNLFETNGSGNVGIASINPGSALDVQGTVRFFNGNVGIGSISPAGLLDVEGGNTSGTIGSGIILAAQNALGAGSGGTVTITAGYSGGGGAGDVSITAGEGAGGGGAGNVTLTAGSASGLGNPGGNASLTGGAALSNNAPGGNATVAGGAGWSGGNVNITAGIGSNTGNGIIDLSGGNVGVGSTKPGTTFDIQGTLRTTQFTMSGQTPVGGYVLTAVDSTGATAWSPAGSVSGWTVSGNNLYETNGSGNVGIGSTNPGAPLDVQGTVRFFSGNVGIGSVNPGQALDVQGTIRTTGFTLATGAASGYILTSNATGIGTWMPNISSQWTTTNVNDVYLPNNGNVGLGTNITNGGALVVMNGNVGIGTWVPTATLQVNGNLATSGSNTGNTTLNTTGGNVGINSTNPGEILDVNGAIRGTSVIDTGVANSLLKTVSGTLSAATAGTDYAAATSGTNLLFGNGSGGFTGVTNTTTSNGNIGLGSTNPGQILDIQGTLRTTQFTMSGQTPVSGYVLTAVDSAGTTSWSPAGSVSGWTTSGNNIYETNGSGNVGIGSTNPGQALDVQGTARLNGFILNGNNAASGFILQSNGVGIGTWVPEPSGSPVGPSNAVEYNNSSVFGGNANFIYTGTNVGLGSATPGQILDVQGTIRTTNFTMSGQTPVGGYVLTAVDSTGATAWSPAGSVSGWTVSGSNLYETNNSGNVGIGSTNPGAPLDVQGTVRFFSGNVGIGSVNPGQALDVQGSIRATGFTLTTGAASGYVLTSNSVGMGTWVAAANSSQWTTTNINDVYLPNNGNVGLGTNITNGGALVVMNGNVGIGTWAPTATLQVNGSFSASGSTGNTTLNTTGGNVGIGTSNPGQTLDVDGAIRGTSIIDTGVANSLLKTSSGTLSAATAGTDYAAATSGTNLLFGNGSGGFTGVVNTATSNGNIGIGSANPGQILDIQGTLRTTQFTMSGQTPVGGYVLTASDSLGDTSWTAPGTVGPWTQTGANIYETGNNVGIGSINPGQILDVQGTVRASGNVGIGSSVVDSSGSPRITLAGGEVDINLQ